MRILKKIGAYFEACSESFASEGQEFAMLGENGVGPGRGVPRRRAANAMRLVLAHREAPGS